jgi:hypothetical protein
MTNRFTEDLLAIDAMHSLVACAGALIKPGLGLFTQLVAATDMFLPELDEFINTRLTFICLLAALSDEDMDELIINWNQEN